jgi:uncharacterized protein YndB with AHSA1/START domain
MLKFEIGSEIKRPVEEVFAYLTDPTTVPEWNSSVLECRAEPAGPLRVGSKMHTVGSILGRRLEPALEVTELVPNRKLVYKTTSPFPLAGTYLTEPTVGGTKVTIEVVAEPGGFFKLAEPVLGRITKKQFEVQLETIKELLEAREATRVGD